MNCTQSYCSKTAEENEENITKLNVSLNRKNLNNLHQHKFTQNKEGGDQIELF